MESQIEVAGRHAPKGRWNEETRCALEASITAAEAAIEETRALMAKIDQILAKRL